MSVDDLEHKRQAAGCRIAWQVLFDLLAQALDPAALLRIGAMIEERTQALAAESTPAQEVA